MHINNTEPAQMLPRGVNSSTPLSDDILIIYPASAPSYQRLTEKLAGIIKQFTGRSPQQTIDIEILPKKSSVLSPVLRNRTLVLLGNLNNNRTIWPLYARYYCATDAVYPGGDGYDLRTLVNPYGTRKNILLLGGSSSQGVARGVDRLAATLEDQANRQPMAVPFLLEVVLDNDLARNLTAWPATPLNAEIPQPGSGHSKALGATEGLLRAIGAYGSMYAWTGDRRYADYAVRCLKSLNAACSGTYGDWHYLAERFIRALPWLNASGLLEPQNVHQTDQLIFGTLLGTQDMWWRMRCGGLPLGHRHQGKGTFEFLLAARYLVEQANPNPAARILCERWMEECYQFLDALVEAEGDDQDDESTLNNLATLTRYALGEERLHYFMSGSARRVAERAIVLHDSMGAGAGQGGYAEGQPGAAYYQQEATTQVAAAAWFYQDGSLKWILNSIPNLNQPLRLGFLGFTPLFIHNFATGDELPEEVPSSYTGLSILPVSEYMYELNKNPPEHYEPAGHSVNAPETWMLGEGIGKVNRPLRHLFNKIVMRSGFEPTAAYLLLQGYQGGFRWQGHLQAANCIVRFSQAGHLFLVQNTSRHAIYHKNGVFVNNGLNTDTVPPFAEILAHADLPRISYSATRLSEYHNTHWARHIFWHKGDPDFFVVVDTVDILTEDIYSLTCTWRTPGSASLNDRTWIAEQGNSRFTLQAGRPVKAFSAVEEDQGAVIPTVLRQVQKGQFQAGERCIFQNLFFVRPRTAAPDVELRALLDGQALVIQSEKPFAWYTINASKSIPAIFGIEARAASAWVSPHELLFSSISSLSFLEPAWRIESEKPIGIHLDLLASMMTLWIDSPANLPISTTLQMEGDYSKMVVLPGERISLPVPHALCKAITGTIETGLKDLFYSFKDEVNESLTTREMSISPQLLPYWSFSGWPLTHERIRNMTVRATPRPLDGFAEQLIDGVLPEMRETWKQWPPADEYLIELSFPEETAINHLIIIGDSDRDPTLHRFHQLPEGIIAEASNDGFQEDKRACQVEKQSSFRNFRRYRDVTDRMEMFQANVGQKVHQIRLRIPSSQSSGPLVLHEVEVYGSGLALPPIRHLQAVDLDGDGVREILASSQAGELAAISQEGKLLWKTDLRSEIGHLSSHDLDGKRNQKICVGLSGGELTILTPDGNIERSAPLAESFRGRGDSAFGWLHNVNSLAVWHRGEDGRASLVVGGYASIAFLDPDLNVIGHSWADGAWQTDILPIAADESNSGNLWVRNGWNHGICVYDAPQTSGPSNSNLIFGGIRQPMFRALQKVIPFVTGRSLAFERLGSDRILAAAEMGFGVLSIDRQQWIWKHEGGIPLTACTAVRDPDGAQDLVYTTSADGFLSAWDLTSGAPVRKQLFGDRITCLGVFPPSGRLAVGMRNSLQLLDSSWRHLATNIGEVQQLVVPNRNTIVTAENGRIRAFRYEMEE